MRPETLARAERALRDGSRARIVARARLKLPARGDERPAVQVLEDALRTAQFDDCGRLIVVRSLVLPCFPVGASSAWVARAIEAAWREQAAHAVHASAGEAPAARAVFFRDVAEARTQLLEALTDGRGTGAWYWPLAVSEFAPGLSRSAAIASVLTVLICESGSPHPPALAALGARLLRWTPSQLRILLEALPAVAPPALTAFARSSDTSGPRGGSSPARGIAPAVMDAGRRESRGRHADAITLLARAIDPGAGSAVVDDWRCTLVAECLLRANTSSASVPPAGLVRDVLQEAANRAAGAPRVEPSARHAGVRAAALRQQEDTSGRAIEPAAVALQGDAAALPDARAERAVESVAARIRSATAAASPFRSPALPWLADAAATRFGGFLLLLNVLDRLGIDAWLALQPPASGSAFVPVLLAGLARRLRMPRDDPHWALLEGYETPQATLREARFQWRTFDWRSWSGLPPVRSSEQSLDASTATWMRALRRVLRMRCGIGLATLVRRDAGLSATATHVDLIFALSATDLRVRRAGLDGDPGWLPWFGRIVALHYIEPPSGSTSRA